jgi:hypothetical protein
MGNRCGQRWRESENRIIWFIMLHEIGYIILFIEILLSQVDLMIDKTNKIYALLMDTILYDISIKARRET